MADAQAGQREQRSNVELRDRVEELLQLARMLNHKRSLMTREELEAAAARIAWLAEEIYRTAVDPSRLVLHDR